MTFSYKNIISMSYPIFLGLLVQNVINVTDTAFMGRIGKIELGASVIGGLFYFCLFTIAFGFGMGSQIVMARREGEGNRTAIGPILWQGCSFLLLLSIIFCLFTYFCGAEIIHHLVCSEAIFLAATEYLSIRMYGLFFSAFNVMFRAFFVGITHTRILTWASVVMAVVNVLFDYLFIFGKGGFPHMGLRGAALASVIAEGATTLFFFIYMQIRVSAQRYGLRRVWWRHTKELCTVLRLSAFTMLQFFFSNLTYFFFFIAVEHLGEFQLAVANIVRSLYIVILIPIQALASTTNSLVSNLIGQGGKEHVINLLRKITIISVSVVGFIALGVALIPKWALRIYTSKTFIVDGSVPALYMVLFSAVMSSVSMIYFSGISGTGRTRMALYIEIGSSCFYVGYIVIFAMYLQASVALCFGCEALYYVLILLLSIWYLRSGKWKYDLRDIASVDR